jgi:hypothetical protein
MKRFALAALFLALAATTWSVTQAAPEAGLSGQGRYRFRVLYTSSHLPAEAQQSLAGAHGGFAVDLRPGRGETYFALKGAGIVQISADLKSTRMVATAPEMRATNLHNTTLWNDARGQAFLEFPGNESHAVYTTTTAGELLHVLRTPAPGAELGLPAANDYFAGAGSFVPTDVEQLDGLLYVTTGYSNLDMVLTARIESTSPFRAVWHDLAWGGKGLEHGRFQTSHGITVPPGTRRLDVADRPNSRIERYTRFGHYLSSLQTPAGSWPCDIYYLDNLAVIGALDGPDRSKGAPIYLYENDRLVSTVLPKDELDLANFKHVHNAVLRRHNGRLYILAQAWNPGDFAILGQVEN